MTAQTCIRLAKDVPNIIGIKEASGKLDQVFEILDGVPAGFSVLSGDDDLTLEMMKHVAKGVISVASNIAPAAVREMTGAALEGRFDEAETVDARLQPLFKNCFVESNPIPVKAALGFLGLCSKEMRLPLTQATPETERIMEETLKNLSL